MIMTHATMTHATHHGIKTSLGNISCQFGLWLLGSKMWSMKCFLTSFLTCIGYGVAVEVVTALISVDSLANNGRYSFS